MILNVRALPPSPNTLRRKYRSPYAYKKLREGWEYLLAYSPQSAMERERWRRTVAGGCRVRLDARLYHRGKYDPDNLPASLKVVIDALVNVRYLVNDDAAHFELGEVEQIVSSDPRTVLHLWAVGEGESHDTHP